MSQEVICFSCKKPTGFETNAKVHRSDECDHCSASLYVCKMCHFYDLTAYNECKEPQADRIVEKEKANFCGFYKLKGSSADLNSKEDLFAAADSLFKKN